METDPEFIHAFVARFGPIDFDLAANAANSQAEHWYGPGSDLGEDSLAQDWTQLNGLLWLNPEYNDIAAWAEKCARTVGRAGLSAIDPGPKPTGRKIAMLVPASVGANWYRRFVHECGKVIFLNGRLTFVGHSNAYPKDLMLVVYGLLPAYEVWQWKR